MLRENGEVQMAMVVARGIYAPRPICHRGKCGGAGWGGPPKLEMGVGGLGEHRKKHPTRGKLSVFFKNKVHMTSKVRMAKWVVAPNWHSGKLARHLVFAVFAKHR